MAVNDHCHKYSQSHDVVLRVGNETFFLEKNILREKCIYFEAMFSGKFAEDSQQEVVIEIISADAMTFVVDYLYKNIVELNDLNNTVEFIEAAMFFQLPKLVKAIVELLIVKIDCLTWVKILHIAKIFSLNDLEGKARCFGLYNFNEIRKNVDCVDSLATMHWYLSHIYLNASSEYDVFQAGCDWLHKNNLEDTSSILVILSCLDYLNLDRMGLNSILQNPLVSNDNLARQVVETIGLMLDCGFTGAFISKGFKKDFTKTIDKNIINIVSGFLLSVKQRTSIEQLCVLRKRNDAYLKKFDRKSNELVNWLEVSNKSWWGHNIVVWKGFNIVVLCGETSMGKNIWNNNILVYSILKEKWSILNSVPVTPRRHAAAVINGDFLYLIGGVNSFRVTLASVMKYDLINDTWESLPDLPECCQTPVATFHNGELYVSAEMLYVFRDNEWVHLFKLSMRHNTILSFQNSLYFAKNWRTTLSQWDTDSAIEYLRSNEDTIKQTKYNITSMCLIGKYIYFLTEPEHFEKQTYCIERCSLEQKLYNTELLMEKEANSDYSYNTSECLVIPDLFIEDESINNFGKRWLDGEVHTNGPESVSCIEPESNVVEVIA